MTVPGNALSVTVGGLTNGRRYTFKVAAINAKGVGLRSLATLPVTIGTPAAPKSPVAVPGNGAVTVSWNASANNGSNLTAYTITAYNFGKVFTSQTFGPNATTATMTGLSNGGTYTFTVSASNALGTGPESLPTALATVGAPATPTNVTATAGASQATVHWTTPTNDNGSSITGYTVTPYLGVAAQPPQVFTSTATTQTVTGLRSGGSYTFTVAAINARGTGPPSAASNPVSVQ